MQGKRLVLRNPFRPSHVHVYMVVPEGFAFPSLPYLFVLLVGALAIGVWFWRSDPPVTAETVLALTPWMALGGGLHVLDVLGVAPSSIAPFLGTPAVYVSTAILAGVVWMVGQYVRPGKTQLFLGITGLLGIVLVLGIVLSVGLSRDALTVQWPLVALLLSIVCTAIIWFVLRGLSPQITQVTAGAGIAVIFGHVLDAFSTAIGVDILHAGERSPLPRAIMNAASHLPTADLIGVGWAFVVVKLALAVGILWLFIPFVRETPRQGYMLLALIAAVGLGPGVHNLLLFAIAG